MEKDLKEYADINKRYTSQLVKVKVHEYTCQKEL